DDLVREIADFVAAGGCRQHAGRQPAVDGQALRRLRHEIRVPLLLHELGDTIERVIPGDRLPAIGAGRAVLRMRQAARAVDEVDQSSTLRAQGAAIDRVIRIALDMEDARSGIFRAIAEAVHENAAGDRTIRARVAGLGGARELELAHFGNRSGGREAQQGEARAGQGGAGYLHELAPRHVSHGNPLACLQTAEVYTPRVSVDTKRSGLRRDAADLPDRDACMPFCYAKATAQCSENPAGDEPRR